MLARRLIRRIAPGDDRDAVAIGEEAGPALGLELGAADGAGRKVTDQDREVQAPAPAAAAAGVANPAEASGVPNVSRGRST